MCTVFADQQPSANVFNHEIFKPILRNCAIISSRRLGAGCETHIYSTMTGQIDGAMHRER